MNIFKRFNIYKIFQSTAFPFAISVFYFKAKGLSMGDILLLESVYALVVVLMEVPSGIFSDLIGKKKALYLANILRLVSHIGFVFGSDFYFFILVHITYGLAQTLFSGTDSALLHDYVEDSYKDKPEDIRQKNYIRLEG